MGQRVIPVAVTAEYIGGDGVTLGAAGSHNSVLVEYDFRSAGPQWEGVSGRYVLWTNPQGNNTNRINLGVSEMVEGYDGVYQAAPPPDAMCVPGWAEMVVVGFTLEDGKEITKVKTEPSRFRVLPGARGSADNEGIATTVADQLQAEIEGVYARLDSEKVNKPTTPYDENGTKGQILETLGDGSTRWRDETVATEEVVDEVLSNHPEWVTTVQPGAITTDKIADGAVTGDKIADGTVTQDKLDSDLSLRVFNAYVTPEMFGAKGDGLTDDTAAVQAAVDFAADQTNGVHEVICNGTYYLTGPAKLTGPSDEEHIDINLTISGTGEVLCAGINAIDLMYVYNATIRGLSFRGSAKQGDWYTVPKVDEDGTRHEGVINACRCARITVEDCRFFDIDLIAAIFFDASEGITVEKCHINRYVYGGINLSNKTKRAQIVNNKIYRCLACYAGADKINSYPISVSSSYRTPFELPGEDIIVANNYIWNEKPHWEGIDAHGGKRITITGNIIINCLCGIAMVHAAVLEDITITGNVCRITNDEELDPGSQSAGYPYLRANIGIQVSGGTDDDVTYKAKNITVSGNTVRAYGRNFSVQKNNNALALFCGIKIQYAENVAVTGNTISDCGPCGIILNSNVNGCVISGNTIQNLSNPQNALQVVGIYMSGASVYALATGNHIIAGTVQMLGIRGPATSPGYCVANNNHFVGSNIQNQYIDATHMVGEVFANSPQAMGSLVGKVGDVCKRNPISGRVYGYVCTAPGDGDTTASQWEEMTYSQ